MNFIVRCYSFSPLPQDPQQVSRIWKICHSFPLQVNPQFSNSHFLQIPKQLGFTTVPIEKPEPAIPETEDEHRVLRDLHTLLLETDVREGKLVCGSCGHEYKIKEGIANFLLPSHLGKKCCSFAPLAPLSLFPSIIFLCVFWRENSSGDALFRLKLSEIARYIGVTTGCSRV